MILRQEHRLSSIVEIVPADDTERAWLEEHCQIEPWQRLPNKKGAFVAELRYAWDVLQAWKQHKRSAASGS